MATSGHLLALALLGCAASTRVAGAQGPPADSDESARVPRPDAAPDGSPAPLGEAAGSSLDRAGAQAVLALRAGEPGEARRRLRDYLSLAERPAERAWAESELARLDATREAPVATRPGVVGLAVPLGGRLRPIGEAALEGALEAAQAYAVSGRATLEVADSAGGAEAAVRDLAARGAPVIVGGLDGAEAALIGGAARALGLRHVALLVPDAAARASMLGREAARAGLRRIVVLAPRGAYGDAVAAAFRGVATVVAEERYATDARSFAESARSVASWRPDGIFIGDAASRLEMIAPALAAAGLWSAPSTGTRRAGADVRFFATAEGVSPRLLRAERYLQGALLAPGFYPDEDDPACGPFSLAFARVRGRPPTVGEAIAYAAVIDARGAERPDWPPFYRVDGDRIRALR